MEFRLIVETSDPGPKASLFLEGRHWVLSERLDLEQEQSLPDFACISYRWGSGREMNPLFHGQISTRACPALAAAMRTQHCNAFWTDAFCIPSVEPQRQATLESMGYIYSRAAAVVIVLGEDTFCLIQTMIRDGFVTEPDLDLLELDEWIASVWTYQEIANGQTVHFVSEKQASTGGSVDCMEFLCALGWSLEKLHKASIADTWTLSQKYPNLRALETALADWQRGCYVYRSAMVVFSSMASKYNDDKANYFYAAIGTLTEKPEHLKWSGSNNLAEQIMSICEYKNDYSFIYTVAERDDDPQRTWRPRACFDSINGEKVPAFLRPMLIWHCWGEAQYGHCNAAGLWLHGMIAMSQTSAIEDTGRDALAQFVTRSNAEDHDDHSLAKAVHGAICFQGFIGYSLPIFVPKGLIFIMTAVETSEVTRILVSTQVRWPQGAPGVVELFRNHTYIYMPCVFIGDVKILLTDGDSVQLNPPQNIPQSATAQCKDSPAPDPHKATRFVS